jgi:hypothetical protein
MAMDQMLGGLLLGFQQGQAQQQNRLNQLARLSDYTFTNSTTSNATSNTIWIDPDGRAVAKPNKPCVVMTLREELQAEADEWLPRLAA